MPPRTALSTTLRGWRCPQCSLRTFTTTAPRRQVGPEHPLFIEVPEPPQRDKPYRPFIKGRLPIPRNIFAGEQGKDRASDVQIANATSVRKRVPKHEEGSREAWKLKITEARKRNLREGLKSLRARKAADEKRIAEREARLASEKAELWARPEREDERLTTTSTGLDLHKLLHGPLEDPHRSARLAHKRRNLQLHTASKRADRLDSLHTLYTHARSFIVSPEQLDQAIEDEFGTAEQPAMFGVQFAAAGTSGSSRGSMGSMWAYGKPAGVQEMLDRANGVQGRRAMEGRVGYAEVNRDRVRRIGEALTGGKMDDGR